MIISKNPDPKVIFAKLYGGVQFDLNNPNVDDVKIEFIAHNLSLICRWNGNIHNFLSVAEHSVMASDLAPPEYKMALLMHDAEEAIIGDIVTPLKHFAPELITLGDTIRNLLLKHFNVLHYDEEVVAYYDKVQLEWERHHFMNNNKMKGLPPEKAYKLFLEKYNEYKTLEEKWATKGVEKVISA